MLLLITLKALYSSEHLQKDGEEFLRNLSDCKVCSDGKDLNKKRVRQNVLSENESDTNEHKRLLKMKS